MTYHVVREVNMKGIRGFALFCIGAFSLVFSPSPVAAAGVDPGGRLQRLSESLYVVKDACNVYVVKRNGRALLIDSGEGAVSGCLEELGVGQVDWVLQTHSHRDQCGATAELARRGAKVAASGAEARFFRDVSSFWDSFDLFIRYAFKPDTYQPRENIPLDLALADNDSLTWQGITFRCLATPGHTEGSASYLAEIDGRKVAFTGDMIHSPGKLWNLYSFDYRYWDGGYKGITLDLAGLDKVLAAGARTFLPSHGEKMDDPASAVAALRENLSRLYDLEPQPEPSERPQTQNVPRKRWNRVSEHLYHVKYTSFVLLSADSSALFYDYYALAGSRSYEHFDSIIPLCRDLGVKRVELIIPSHFHEDHLRGIPDLVQRSGAKVWVFENMADILENPSRYNLPCLAPERIKADRVLHDGEKIRWKEYEFTVLHFPGQTMYHQAMFGMVDGKKVMFMGDSDVYDLNDPNLFRRNQKLHGISTFLNYYLLEPGQGYLKAIQRLIDYNPELLLYAHSGAKPGNMEIYRANLEAMSKRRELAAAVLPQADPNIGFDPNRVSFYPYSLEISEGKVFETEVMFRNHLPEAVETEISLSVPESWHVEPPAIRLNVAAKAESGALFKVRPGDRPAGRRRAVITASVISGSENLGEPAEMLLEWKQD